MLRLSLTAIVLRLLAALTAFGSMMLLGRWLAPKDFGYYASLMAALGLLTHLCAMGLPMTLLRFLGSGQGGRVLVVVALRRAGLVALLVVLLASVALRDLTYAVGLALLPAYCLHEVLAAALRAQGRIIAALLPRDVIWRASLLPFGAWAASFVAGDQALHLFVGAHIAIAATLVWQAFKLLRRDFLATGPLPRFGAISRRIWAANLAGVVLANVDTLCVAWLLGIEASGLYFAAVRTASLPSFAHNAISAVIAPRIARSFHQGRFDDLSSELRLAAQLASLPAAGALLIFLLFGRQLLGALGEEFGAMYSVLLLLGAAQLVNGMTGAAGLLLSMTGNEDVHARLSIGTVLVAVVAVPISGLFAGAVGIAAMTFVVIGGYEVALWVVALRKTGFDGSIAAGWRKMA